MKPGSSTDDPAIPFSRVATFVRQVTHDVRNGLNAIDLEAAFISEIVTDAEVADEVKKLRGMVRSVTNSLQQLSANFSDPSLNAIDLKARDFLDAFRERVKEHFAEDAGRIEWAIDVKDEDVKMDFELLATALFKLLTNAFQFQKENSPVVFRASVEGQNVALDVVQKNAPPATDPAAWGREPLLSTRRSGYGLGLFYARRIIEAHDGTLEGRRDGDALIMRVALPVFTAASRVMKKIVVIDDERPVLMTLEALLKRKGYEVHLAPTASTGLAAIDKVQPDLVLQDLGLPDAEGLETLKNIREKHPEIIVVIITANDSLNNAIESIKLGAFHFISKPYAPEELLNVVSRALEQRELVIETKSLRAEKEMLSRRLEEVEQKLAPVFQSRRMREIEDLVKRVAPSDANVLITGESGVGKEVIASQIHRQSQRANGPMVKLNCAAFPQNMIEAELFGYVKGAFTGAVNDFPGMIHQAGGGTLFLDEIAEMPPDLQTRFLRVLQEREFRPLGSTKTIKADFRLIAATNRNLDEALRDGHLRQDLYYRLKTFHLDIPPLRERREDIPTLVALFSKRFAEQMKKPEPTITPEAFRFLMDYTWPGNVRELQNAIEHSLILSENGIVTEKQMPRELQLPPALQEIAMRAQNGDTLNLDEREKQAILKALAQTHGNKKKAAEVLGIHRPTLYAKMKRFGIQL